MTVASHPAARAAAQASLIAAKGWSAMSPHQRLAVLDLIKATMQAEIDKSLIDMNAFLAERGVPAEVDIEVRLRIDPNRDPRLDR